MSNGVVGLYTMDCRTNGETAEDEEHSDASSDDVYYDCDEGPLLQKPSIIRWSSELELECCDESECQIISLCSLLDSAPATPSTAADAALLVMVFHGDFSPEHPADSKTTDSKTFKCE